MVTNNFYQSDLPRIYNIVQNSMTLQPKELVVATLRDFFSNDRYYAYHHDAWGYPITPDLTNTPSTAGYNDATTTRVFIGEAFRFDVNFFPAILVHSGASTSVAASINREAYSTVWGHLVFEDGYGNVKTFPTPRFFVFQGFFVGSIVIEIKARDLRARDDLADLITLLFTDIAFNDLVHDGLIVTGVERSASGETQDRNDFFFTYTITLQCRSEWRREIPISNLIEIINFGVEFAGPSKIVAQNLTITDTNTLYEVLAKL